MLMVDSVFIIFAVLLFVDLPFAPEYTSLWQCTFSMFVCALSQSGVKSIKCSGTSSLGGEETI